MDDMEFMWLAVGVIFSAIVLGALIYNISRAAMRDELDERGLGRSRRGRK